MYRIEVNTLAVDSLGFPTIGPKGQRLRIAALANHQGTVYASSANGRLYRMGETNIWEYTDQIPQQYGAPRAMTTALGIIFISTSNGNFLAYHPRVREWINTGSTARITSLAAVDDTLVAQAESGGFIRRSAVPWFDEWQAFGGPDLRFSSFAIVGNQFVGTVETGDVVFVGSRQRPIFSTLPDDASSGGSMIAAAMLVRTPINLQLSPIDTAPLGTITMTSAGGTLYAVDGADNLFSRPARGGPIAWQRLGTANGITSLFSSGASLYGFSASGTLLRARFGFLGAQMTWEEIPDDQRPTPGTVRAAAGLGSLAYVIIATTTNTPPAPGNPTGTTITSLKMYRRVNLNANASYEFTGDQPGSGTARLTAGSGKLYSLEMPAPGATGARTWMRRADMPGFWVINDEDLAAAGLWYNYQRGASGAPGRPTFTATNIPQAVFGVESGKPALTVAATDFMLVRGLDIGLLRLAQNVPANIATPMGVELGLGVEPASVWPSRTFRMVGWGNWWNSAASQAAPAPPPVRQTARANGVHQYPRLEGSRVPKYFSPSHIAVIAGSAGGAALQGDSGGPLLWRRSNSSTELVVGVVNIGGGAASPPSPNSRSIYAVTFFRGGPDGFGVVKPATGRWLGAVLLISALSPNGTTARFFDQRWN